MSVGVRVGKNLLPFLEFLSSIVKLNKYFFFSEPLGFKWQKAQQPFVMSICGSDVCPLLTLRDPPQIHLYNLNSYRSNNNH